MANLICSGKKITLACLLLLAMSFLEAKDVCVTDDSGINLCLPFPPKYIISLAPGSTELLYAAGAGKQLLAVDQYSDFPEAAKQLPKVGGYSNVSIETLVDMAPNLIVAWTGGNSPQLISQIERAGLKIFRLNAITLEDIASDIRKLGEITGNEKVANKNADAFVIRLAQLKATYEQQAPVSVFFEIWRSPLMSVGGQNVMNDTITLCGGRNIFADAGSGFPVISIESLLSRNPDVILSSSPDQNHNKNQTSMNNYWSTWPMLKSVKKSQLFSVHSDLITRPSPRILEGAEQICQYLQAVRVKENPNQLHSSKSNDNIQKEAHEAHVVP